MGGANQGNHAGPHVLGALWSWVGARRIDCRPAPRSVKGASHRLICPWAPHPAKVVSGFIDSWMLLNKLILVMVPCGFCFYISSISRQMPGKHIQMFFFAHTGEKLVITAESAVIKLNSGADYIYSKTIFQQILLQI